MKTAPTPRPGWRQATATVSSVEPKHGVSRTLETDGSPGGDYYLIHFRYVVHGQTYGGNFESRITIPPEDTFDILYNPADPQQNTKSGPVSSGNRRITLAVAVAVIAIILAIVVVILLRRQRRSQSPSSAAHACMARRQLPT